MKIYMFFGCMVFLTGTCVCMLLAKTNTGIMIGFASLVIAIVVSLYMSAGSRPKAQIRNE